MEGEKRRSGKSSVWRKLHLAVVTHEVICTDLSLNNVTDSEAIPGLIRQTYRKVNVAYADGAYDTKRCHDELRRKKIKALIPPRTQAGYWPVEYADRNQAVARQRLTGSNAYWKWNTSYNLRSVAETAMPRAEIYIASLLKSLKNDKRFIFKAAHAASKAHHCLMGF